MVFECDYGSGFYPGYFAEDTARGGFTGGRDARRELPQGLRAGTQFTVNYITQYQAENRTGGLYDTDNVDNK